MTQWSSISIDVGCDFRMCRRQLFQEPERRFLDRRDLQWKNMPRILRPG
jgi:hypothetical protein